MPDHPPDDQSLDRKTSQSICNAVGQGLQRDLSPKSQASSSRLERLMDELRRRDAEEHRAR